MLYKDVEDCGQCPFYKELCPGGDSISPLGTMIEPPCDLWDGNDDVNELYKKAVEGLKRYEDAEDRKIRKDKILKEKKDEKNKRLRESRNEVREEQQEINGLKRRIKKNNELLNSAQNMAEATNFANKMFGYEGRVKVNSSIIEDSNNKMGARIEELNKIKKEKLKKLRKGR